jgi:hypothetical protein
MMKIGATYCFQMSRVFASMGQTDVDEYGEGPEKDMLQLVLTRDFHLAVGRLWFGRESLQKHAQTWSSYRMAPDSSQVHYGSFRGSRYAFHDHYG